MKNFSCKIGKHCYHYGSTGKMVKLEDHKDFGSLVAPSRIEVCCRCGKMRRIVLSGEAYFVSFDTWKILEKETDYLEVSKK